MKTLLVSFFVFLTLVASTVFAYQEWLKTQNYFDFNNVQTLSETSKIQSVSAPEGKRLVPRGAILGMNDVDEVYFTYFVEVESGKSLEVSVSRAFFSKNNSVFEDSYNLLAFEISVDMTDTETAEVTVCVYLNMPDSQEVANMIVGSSASFELYFSQI